MRLEFFKETPSLALLVKFVLHLVVVGELRHGTSEVLTVFGSLLYACLHFCPLSHDLSHHLRSFHSFLVSELVAFFGLLFLPFVEHFLEVGVQGADFVVKLLDESSFLLLYLVLESTKASVEFTPHSFNFSKSHGLTSHLLDHFVLKLTAVKNLDDGNLFNTNLHGISGHLLDLFYAGGVLSEFVKTLPDELVNIVGVLLDRFLESLHKDV